MSEKNTNGQNETPNTGSNDLHADGQSDSDQKNHSSNDSDQKLENNNNSGANDNNSNSNREDNTSNSDYINSLSLNFKHCEHLGSENGFLIYKYNFDSSQIFKQPNPLPKVPSSPNYSKSTTKNKDDLINITSKSAENFIRKLTKKNKDETDNILLSHKYTNNPKKFNEIYYQQQQTCYMKNKNSSLAHFQGLCKKKFDDHFLPIVLTERPLNGPLSSFFSGEEKEVFFKKSSKPVPFSGFTAEQKFNIIIGIIHGIAFIHKNNFIHSNLNPTTVYLNEKLQPIICDYIFIPPFKITTIKNDSDDDDDDEYRFKYSIDPEEPTIEFENKKYVAPEIIEGKEFSREVDIYSFGRIIEYILREGEESTKPEDNKIGEKWNKLINKCIKQEPKERPTAIDILTELLKEENVKEYISEITPNSSTQEISNKTNLTVTLIRNDVKNDLNSEKLEMKIFHYMIPNIGELDEDTKLVISVAEKGDIASISKVGYWFYTGENNFYQDYEWSYECYKTAADKTYEIFKSRTESTRRAEKKDLYPIIQVAEFNEKGIGTDINLRMSHEYYEKALEILKEDDPERSEIENKMNEINNKMCILKIENIEATITKEKLESYFFRILEKNIKVDIITVKEHNRQTTIQFDNLEDKNAVINTLKENNNKLFTYKDVLTQKVKSQRFESLTNDIEKYEFDDFKIIDKKPLEEGGFATTYKVLNTKTKKLFVAKIFQDSFESDYKKYKIDESKNLVNIFKREIIMSNRLNHPAIIKYKGFNEHSLFNHFYKKRLIYEMKPTIFMEYYPGGDLEAAIKNKSNLLTDTNKLKIIIGIASGLSEFFEKGIIHRDLKPGNILLTEKTEPIICDLGSSRQCLEVSNSMTKKFGSPIYMAPELYNDDLGLVYKYEVDSYSFGIILYQILTLTKSENVYNLKHPYQLMIKKLNNYVAPLPNDMNDIFKNLITSCWNCKINDRPKPPMIYSILKEAIFNNEQLLPNANLDEVKEYIKTLPNNKLEKVKKYIKTLPASDIENIKEFFNKNPTTNLEEFKGYIKTISNKNNEEFKKYVYALLNSDLDEIKEYIKTLPNDKLEKV